MSEENFDDEYNGFDDSDSDTDGKDNTSPDISNMNLVLNGYMLPESLSDECVIDIPVFGCSVSEDIMQEKGVSRLYINNLNRTEYFHSGVSFAIAHSTQNNAEKISFVLAAMDDIDREEARRAAFRAAFVSDFRIYNPEAAEKLNKEWVIRQNRMYSGPDFNDDAKHNHIIDELTEFLEISNPESPLGQSITAALRYTVSSVENPNTAQNLCYMLLLNNGLSHIHGFARKQFMKRFTEAETIKYDYIAGLILDNETSHETRAWAFDVWKDVNDKHASPDKFKAEKAYELYESAGQDSSISEYIEEYILLKLDGERIADNIIEYSGKIAPEFTRLHGKLADRWLIELDAMCNIIPDDDINRQEFLLLGKRTFARNTIEECRPGCALDDVAKRTYIDCLASLPQNEQDEAEKELNHTLITQEENHSDFTSFYYDPITLDNKYIASGKEELRKRYGFIINNRERGEDVFFAVAECIQIINNGSDNARRKFNSSYSLYSAVQNTPNEDSGADLLLKYLSPGSFANFTEYSEAFYDCYLVFGEKKSLGKKLISEYDKAIDIVKNHLGENAAVFSLVFTTEINNENRGLANYSINKISDIIKNSQNSSELLNLAKNAVATFGLYNPGSFKDISRRLEILENETTINNPQASASENIPPAPKP